ncbi:hypothetical protein [Marivita sp. GX14005]|uniref:hypothetical protein n=1 Tax=Marivita sp. GX14005 TaxID=2942276 RepID=UPI0020193925|nr:hypothetical protein [Marivita sp. GX14005]MCL3880698.1 hypothetical protein [Marivita sp. GX14005]
MTRKPASDKSEAEAREDRLKAALKANLARRKAQVRGRIGEQTGGERAGGDTSDNGKSGKGV